MYSKTEQLFLLEMLKAKQTNGVFKQNRSYFYRTMRLLEQNGAVRVRNSDPLEFELTVFGECLASFIAKHSNTPLKWRRYSHTVEMYLLRQGVEI